MAEPYRSGFACFVGRPNAGKSTLVNALVGEKVAITSTKPQTTRHAIRGIVHREDGQLIVVDTPGLHRPRTLLGERLNDVVRSTLAEVDLVGFCLPADQRLGPGDRYIANELAMLKHTPKFAIVTKTDVATRDQIAVALAAVTELGSDLGVDWVEVVPVSAVSGDQVALLAGLVLAALPEGPPLYPDGELTDEPEETLVAELIREAALEGVRDELPHSIAVVVEEMIPRGGAADVIGGTGRGSGRSPRGGAADVIGGTGRGSGRSPRDDRPSGRPLLDVHALIYVERDSQKSIVIGKGGARLRDVGTRARGHIERLLGTRVHLDLHVKVAKDWQRDPRQLRKLGF